MFIIFLLVMFIAQACMVNSAGKRMLAWRKLCLEYRAFCEGLIKRYENRGEEWRNEEITWLNNELQKLEKELQSENNKKSGQAEVN